MSTNTATPKGAATRESIVGRAYEIARASGVEGLSIGPLATAVGMSKSGVFAHFGSREDLQLAVLEEAATRFGNAVLIPALSQPRGLPRLRAIMHNWFEWVRGTAGGGCVLLGSVTEYDDRPGPLRDQVLHNERRWRSELERAVRLAIDAGQLADGDADQYVFELYAIPLTVHHEAGLFGYDLARKHGDAAVERWIADHVPAPAARSTPTR
ncbi:MAG TPA: TetR/AcrR family transcriptional regulator [Lysobacter sp.]|nr:TetR/AcrR family transcriptional regulator [Lysobacter sp.]